MKREGAAVIEGRAYTKEHTADEVRALVQERHGYEPDQVFDAGTVWIATRPEVDAAPSRQDVSNHVLADEGQGGLVGDLLTGYQLELFGGVM